MFHHGWPLSSDDWDNQMLFFLANGYRVVAHDRRGHGRSSQVDTGHDMDHYASDASAVAEHLDLRNAVHIGHSTGGGEVARYVAKYGEPQGRVAKAVLLASVPPLMLKTEKNPGGTPIEVFDGFRKVVAENRAQFFLDFASGPFYGFNRPGAKALQGVIQNWWRQGMMGSALAHYEGIKAFSEVDQTDDLKAITVPTLVMQGDDDQVVPYKDASLLQAKLLKHGNAQDLPWLPSRLDDHPCRRDQCGPPGIHPKLNPRGAALSGPALAASCKAGRAVAARWPRPVVAVSGIGCSHCEWTAPGWIKLRTIRIGN